MRSREGHRLHRRPVQRVIGSRQEYAWLIEERRFLDTGRGHAASARDIQTPRARGPDGERVADRQLRKSPLGLRLARACFRIAADRDRLHTARGEFGNELIQLGDVGRADWAMQPTVEHDQ